MVNRNKKHQVSHLSHSLWKQRLHDQEFSRTFFIQQSAVWNLIFQKTGRKARLQNHCAQMVLHWKMHLMHHLHHLHQEHASQYVRTLESQPRSIVINFTCKDGVATWISGLPVENVELLTLHLFCSVINWFSTAAQQFQQNMPNLEYFI